MKWSGKFVHINFSRWIKLFFLLCFCFASVYRYLMFVDVIIDLCEMLIHWRLTSMTSVICTRYIKSGLFACCLSRVFNCSYVCQHVCVNDNTATAVRECTFVKMNPSAWFQFLLLDSEYLRFLLQSWIKSQKQYLAAHRPHFAVLCIVGLVCWLVSYKRPWSAHADQA